jgi:predicted dehydrogenase
MGYISPSHIESIRRTGIAEVKCCTDTDTVLAKKKANDWNIPLVYTSIDEILEDPEIQVIHNCTPNFLHKEINEKVIISGKHLFSEKPLARDSKESEILVNLLRQNPDIVAGVNFNYRMNPLLQDMKVKLKAGEYGTPRLVHGSYLQDWLLYETDYNWRLDREMSGTSNTMADIGSHWMDTAQTVLDSKITRVYANLITNIPVRKKARGMVEAFAKQEEKDFENKKIEVEDAGMVMVEFDNGAQGMFMVSQVSAGRKCRLDLEINGSEASAYWNQELADQMWIGKRDEPNQQVFRNPMWMSPETQMHTGLAAGHPEGWNDAMTNNVKAFYRFIFEGKKLNEEKPVFATFEEAHYIIKLVEAIIESSVKREWVKV